MTNVAPTYVPRMTDSAAEVKDSVRCTECGRVERYVLGAKERKHQVCSGCAKTTNCGRCGFDFIWYGSHHLKVPEVCPDCRKAIHGTGRARIGRGDGQYDLALAVTTYRLAIEMATALLRTDRALLALQVLEEVQAPARGKMNKRSMTA